MVRYRTTLSLSKGHPIPRRNPRRIVRNPRRSIRKLRIRIGKPRMQRPLKRGDLPIVLRQRAVQRMIPKQSVDVNIRRPRLRTSRAPGEKKNRSQQRSSHQNLCS